MREIVLILVLLSMISFVNADYGNFTQFNETESNFTNENITITNFIYFENLTEGDIIQGFNLTFKIIDLPDEYLNSTNINITKYYKDEINQSNVTMPTNTSYSITFKVIGYLDYFYEFNSNAKDFKILMQFYYPDDDNDGIVDGYNFSEDYLNVRYYLPESNLWYDNDISEGGQYAYLFEGFDKEGHNTLNNTMQVLLSHFSLYSIVFEEVTGLPVCMEDNTCEKTNQNSGSGSSGSSSGAGGSSKKKQQIILNPRTDPTIIPLENLTDEQKYGRNYDIKPTSNGALIQEKIVIKEDLNIKPTAQIRWYQRLWNKIKEIFL